MTEKPATRAMLQGRIEALKDQFERAVADTRAERDRRVAAEAAEKETRAQFADLKERLAFCEAELQRMGGYIARVHEDDVVREPLVSVGEPEGEQRLVPKRKHASFADFRAAGGVPRDIGERYLTDGVSAPRRPRHWVNY